MDFARQCRRFLNYQVINHQHFHKKLANISALSVLKNTGKLNKETNIAPITYKLIIADSEEKILMIISESDHQLIKEAKVNYRQAETKRWRSATKRTMWHSRKQ